MKKTRSSPHRRIPGGVGVARSFLLGLPALAISLAAVPWIPCQTASAAGQAEHAVIVVWDGLRPDMVNASNTPTLEKLRLGGTFFSRHHAVYPSTTEVNGTALATGMYPAGSGIIGNREFRPKLNPAEPVATESLEAIRRGDELTGGKYLAVPTIYEMVQAVGLPTMVAGTKPVAVLADRSGDRSTGASAKSQNVFAGKSLPPSLLADIESSHGKFPEKPTFPDVPQNAWTVQVLLGNLWKDGVPKLTLLWMSDPDFTQHDSQPGSTPALASLRENDKLLEDLLDALEKKGVREKTDILLVSDHGFSTIDKSVDTAGLLAEAGFRATRKFTRAPESGEILVVSNGGSDFFYVVDHDRETTRRLVGFLQQCGLCGVIFSSSGLPGTFDLAAARINSPDAPDVVASFQWNSSPNASGVNGLIVADAASVKKQGQGMHGSLSPYDMHNTLIANGPDFRAGFVDDLPSGNVDVAPTVLWILGIPPAHKIDGRILVESLRNPPFPAGPVRENTLSSENGRWHQYLKTSSVGETQYLDEGNSGPRKD
ncbi:MAG: alkaline phosphatase family protein [Terrimicrobiaceae bacterium]